MFGKFIVLLLAAVLAVGVAARASHGSGRAAHYVVRPADTLWSIAARHYGGDPREGVWKIEHANHIGNAATLRPGQTLLLP
jgi:nucleoid-associated protein YgaU